MLENLKLRAKVTFDPQLLGVGIYRCETITKSTKGMRDCWFHRVIKGIFMLFSSPRYKTVVDECGMILNRQMFRDEDLRGDQIS